MDIPRKKSDDKKTIKIMKMKNNNTKKCLSYLCLQYTVVKLPVFKIRLYWSIVGSMVEYKAIAQVLF